MKKQKNQKIQELIEIIKDFNKHDYNDFIFEINKLRHFDLSQYENPLSTNEDAYELQKRLVKTCIDFINEKKLNDITEVHFHADSLDDSTEYGEWTPATDSSLMLIGIQYEDDNRYPVRKIIAESY